MDSANFTTVLVKDSLLADISPVLEVGVESGPAENNWQSNVANSVSNSQLTFTITSPGIDIVVDRKLLITSTVCGNLTLGYTNGNVPTAGNVASPSSVPTGELAFAYGVSDSLQAFPINSLFNTSTCQINSASITTQTQQILPVLLRMMTNEQLASFNGMCPSLPDCAYQNYANGLGTTNNPLAGFANGNLDALILPRGAHPFQIVSVSHQSRNIVGAANIGAPDQNLLSTGIYDSWSIDFAFNSTEPLILSPFLWHDSDDNAGLLGVNNMNFNFNLDSSCKRLFSTATNYMTQVQLGHRNAVGGVAPNPLGFRSYGTIDNMPQSSFAPTILLHLVTVPEIMHIDTKNVIPYVRYDQFTSNLTSMPVIAAYDPAAPVTTTITSSQYQLSGVPDRLILAVQTPYLQKTAQSSNSFFAIKRVSITFNNKSGILSNASVFHLWKMCQKNGSKQSFAEFSGQVVLNGIAAGATIGYPTFVNTTGSILVIDPAMDLGLPSILTNGSAGQFYVQFTIDVVNLGAADVQPEILLITPHSGTFSTQLGTSTINTNVITQEITVAAKRGTGIARETSDSDVHRMTGGRMFHSVTGYRGMNRSWKGGHASGGHMSGAGMKHLLAHSAEPQSKLAKHY